MLRRRLQVGVGVDPRVAALPGEAAALLAEVLLHGVGQVLVPDAGALVARVDQRDHVEHVLEPIGVVGLGVPSPRPVEALQRAATITAVESGTRFAQGAVGMGGHGGDGPYPFRHAFGTHACAGRGYVRLMDEARAVLRRLERIEALEREGAPARSLLAEVHALVEEAEAWVAAERGDAEDAVAALDRCRAALMEPATVR